MADDKVESTPGGRTAALITAAVIFGGIIAGIVIPRVITQTQVEYGAWSGGDPATRRCTEGNVWIADDVRALGHLPTQAESQPYCWYRACYEASATTPEAEALFNAQGGVPSSMDPLLASFEEPWQDPWPPLTVWCGGDTDPSPCACRPLSDTTGACLWTPGTLDGTVGPPVPAPFGTTLSAGQWSGVCLKTACTVLAGRDWFPPACTLPPAPPAPPAPEDMPPPPVEPTP